MITTIYTAPQGLGWKDVFNAHKRLLQNMSEAAQRAADAGYDFMSWNGRVYKIETHYHRNFETNLVQTIQTDMLSEQLA